MPKTEPGLLVGRDRQTDSCKPVMILPWKALFFKKVMIHALKD
jgi:hypothetical protein